MSVMYAMVPATETGGLAHPGLQLVPVMTLAFQAADIGPWR